MYVTSIQQKISLSKILLEKYSHIYDNNNNNDMGGVFMCPCKGEMPKEA